MLLLYFSPHTPQIRKNSMLTLFGYLPQFFAPFSGITPMLTPIFIIIHLLPPMG